MSEHLVFTTYQPTILIDKKPKDRKIDVIRRAFLPVYDHKWSPKRKENSIQSLSSYKVDLLWEGYGILFGCWKGNLLDIIYKPCFSKIIISQHLLTLIKLDLYILFCSLFSKTLNIYRIFPPLPPLPLERLLRKTSRFTNVPNSSVTLRVRLVCSCKTKRDPSFRSNRQERTQMEAWQYSSLKSQFSCLLQLLSGTSKNKRYLTWQLVCLLCEISVFGGFPIVYRCVFMRANTRSARLSRIARSISGWLLTVVCVLSQLCVTC